MAGGANFNTTEQWLANEWSIRLRQSVEAMTCEPAQVQLVPGDPSPPGGAAWWRQPFEIRPGAAVWVGAPRETWIAVGGKVLAGAGIDDSTEDDRRSTYQEILQQALAGMAHGFTGLLGREVLAGTGEDGTPPPATVVEFKVTLGAGGGSLQLFAGWNKELVQGLGLTSGASAAKQDDDAAPPSQSVPELAQARQAGAQEVPARTLELLYDVELPVSVSFGRALLPLKEVLKLTSGSIVELNRTVAEPVEVIVNNCVIARGEVVVVEGNYGVRIQQIVSRSERLRTLH